MSDSTGAKQSNLPNQRKLGRLMHYLVSNAYSFTVGVMGFVHATLMIIFLIADVMPLVYFNILSVVVYLFCFMLCRFGHILPVYASVIIEVTVYTVLSTYFVGLKCGTYCFLFSIIPIIIYFGSSLFKGRKRWSVILMLVLNFLTFMILYIRFAPVEPVYDVSPVIRMVLVIFSAFAMVFATMFYNAMYIYSSENAVNILQQKNRQLSIDAHEDTLTSLLNRRGFLPLIQELMGRKTKHFCIAFCDLDDFKVVNDSYGHEAGDEVLKHITKLIRKELPGCDICRWGGEEFVILMRDYDLQVATAKVEHLRRSIEDNPTSFFSNKIYVTTTIGLEEYSEKYANPEDIIKVADARMYYGKQHGKNILIYEDL